MLDTVGFLRAVPVWEAGKEREMNQMLCFEAELDLTEDSVLRIAGQTGYRVFINGEFVHFGPARAGRGCYRVEEIPLRQAGHVRITVIATGYYCASFYWLREESFLCAEVVCKGKVLAATGDGGFVAYTVPSHLQRVRRYSYQRTFCEVYDERGALERRRVELIGVGEKRWIDRQIPIPVFDRIVCNTVVQEGTVAWKAEENNFQSRFLEPSDCVDAFPSETLEFDSLCASAFSHTPVSDRAREFPVLLSPEHYVTAKLEGNRTGLLELEVEALDDVDLYLTFDEILCEGRVDFLRMGCVNALIYRLEKGKRYHLFSAEPYTLGYADLIAVGGAIRINFFGMRRVGFDTRSIVKRIAPHADPIIARIAHAAEQAFCQNAFDVFMDCPSRERAGWLCDSFFTARVEYLLTGKSEVERAFLSNFLMESHFEGLPDGMLPMCYPADVLKGEYIPNWAMWLCLQLEEYYGRTADRVLLDAFKPKLYALLDYFRPFENSDGLLERLTGWIFVEWSHCNKLVQDVNYPTNMLYYRFKRALASLYGDAGLEREAEELRSTIRVQSKGELFFCDNAVYGEDGVAHLSGEITETCQYYAFFMGIATMKEDRALWEVLVRDFGPQRKRENPLPHVHFSNAFMGNYMRMELLSHAGENTLLEQNIRDYFDGMARTTDTLWEHDSVVASCNHGFASHVLLWLDRLGYLI